MSHEVERTDADRHRFGRSPSAILVRADFFQRFLAFGALIVLILFFQVSSPHFPTLENFRQHPRRRPSSASWRWAKPS